MLIIHIHVEFKTLCVLLQNRRSGLVKDVADKSTDDYNWPYCSGRSVHQMSQLMLTAIIPANCLIDLAKKLHSLRHRWKIPQFCHQSDELRTLYTQDDGFLNLQTVSLIFELKTCFLKFKYILFCSFKCMVKFYPVQFQ